MGYNNNYAGMHMIRYSRYGQYDDLKYYDKLAEQEKQCKKVNARPENSNSEDRKNKFKKKLVDLNNKYGGGYGVDELIDAHHFVYSNIVMSNVMIIAMKNKKDIYEILTECENTMIKITVKKICTLIHIDFSIMRIYIQPRLSLFNQPINKILSLCWFINKEIPYIAI